MRLQNLDKQLSFRERITSLLLKVAGSLSVKRHRCPTLSLRHVCFTVACGGEGALFTLDRLSLSKLTPTGGYSETDADTGGRRMPGLSQMIPE